VEIGLIIIYIQRQRDTSALCVKAISIARPLSRMASSSSLFHNHLSHWLSLLSEINEELLFIIAAQW